LKLFIFLALLCLLSAAVVARDLTEAAKKERARRQAIQESRRGEKARTFTDSDLKRYRRSGPRSPSIHQSKPRKTRPERDWAKERAFWEKEKEKHQNNLARLDARIRRLEWRLAERKARRRPGERLREDPAEKVLEQTLEALHEERKRLTEEFRDRGRRAGALPGWLR
jgi:hypothetical protein